MSRIKHLFLTSILLTFGIAGTLLLQSSVHASTTIRDRSLGTESAVQKTLTGSKQYQIESGEGDGEAKVYTLIGNVINIVLGFLGLIALILVIWSGVQWMTSGGNEDKTKEAKDRMKAGVIGLMIILGAAVLTNFILDLIIKTTTTSS
ncbi:MAG: hypothetical protein UV70_C0018G0006 [Parcubacteria group bacterium GW2011_GWA2_43_13]|nr:MAG: hypothetical protein UV70_C0018G0006 [Parcubacteria group bacterium GW2011_GWA2_43_13]OGY69876.1 MAG: hypothetical protein A3B94_02655 [Candidatus Jacksonbacteria bacterium RIFCSPHIGHO2_02_FULL_43_10]